MEMDEAEFWHGSENAWQQDEPPMSSAAIAEAFDMNEAFEADQYFNLWFAWFRVWGQAHQEGLA